MRDKNHVQRENGWKWEKETKNGKWALHSRVSLAFQYYKNLWDATWQRQFLYCFWTCEIGRHGSTFKERQKLVLCLNGRVRSINCCEAAILVTKLSSLEKNSSQRY